MAYIVCNMVYTVYDMMYIYIYTYMVYILCVNGRIACFVVFLFWSLRNRLNYLFLSLVGEQSISGHLLVAPENTKPRNTVGMRSYWNSNSVGLHLVSHYTYHDYVLCLALRKGSFEFDAVGTWPGGGAQTLLERRPARRECYLRPVLKPSSWRLRCGSFVGLLWFSGSG